MFVVYRQNNNTRARAEHTHIFIYIFIHTRNTHTYSSLSLFLSYTQTQTRTRALSNRSSSSRGFHRTAGKPAQTLRSKLETLLQVLSFYSSPQNIFSLCDCTNCCLASISLSRARLCRVVFPFCSRKTRASLRFVAT